VRIIHLEAAVTSSGEARRDKEIHSRLHPDNTDADWLLAMLHR